MLVASALLLVGADSEPDLDLARLEAMPLEERRRLWETLQRFDRLKASDQKLAREIDRRIAEIENPSQKAHYLRVMRRYHLWLEALPETKRDAILKSAPDARMALVSKFMAEERNATKALPALLPLQIADMGGFPAVDVALIYKLWQGLGAQERAGFEALPPQQFRNQISRQVVKAGLSPKDVLPAEYQENSWVTQIENVQQRPLAKAKVFDQAKRHLALNLYFLKNPPKPVPAPNLMQFVNELPATVRSTYDIFPPEEARRRLTVAYRLVFPTGEIKPPSRPPASPGGPATTPPPATGAPGTNAPGISPPANPNPKSGLPF
jgi:hypothetical protein